MVIELHFRNSIFVSSSHNFFSHQVVVVVDVVASSVECFLRPETDWGWNLDGKKKLVSLKSPA